MYYILYYIMNNSLNDWQLYFLNKFKIINDKATSITNSIKEKEDLWSVDDMAGHMKDVIDILAQLDAKIDDIQYQLDNNKILQSATEIERIKKYEIERKVMQELIPYMQLFHTYYSTSNRV